MAKEYMTILPDDPSDGPCYQVNPLLWNLIRRVKNLPEYMIGMKYPDGDPIFTEADAVRELDEYFGFPPPAACG